MEKVTWYNSMPAMLEALIIHVSSLECHLDRTISSDPVLLPVTALCACREGVPTGGSHSRASHHRRTAGTTCMTLGSELLPYAKFWVWPNWAILNAMPLRCGAGVQYGDDCRFGWVSGSQHRSVEEMMKNRKRSSHRRSKEKVDREEKARYELEAGG